MVSTRAVAPVKLSANSIAVSRPDLRQNKRAGHAGRIRQTDRQIGCRACSLMAIKKGDGLIQRLFLCVKCHRQLACAFRSMRTQLHPVCWPVGRTFIRVVYQFATAATKRLRAWLLESPFCPAACLACAKYRKSWSHGNRGSDERRKE